MKKNYFKVVISCFVCATLTMVVTFTSCDKDDDKVPVAPKKNIEVVSNGFSPDSTSETFKQGTEWGSGITATNAGNIPAILSGLNPKNGNSLFNKNAPEDPEKSTPFVVPNSNHFVFAKMTKSELEAGVELEFVFGNRYDVVGTGFVKWVDNNIVLTINKFANGNFGLIAFNQLPITNNGYIHLQKETDLKKIGVLAGFNHDNKLVVPCPAGDTIYLYFHAGSLQFYL